MTGPLRRILESAASRAGAHYVGRRGNRRRLLIVCYHGVARAGDPRHWLLMPAGVFDGQLAHLARHYRVLRIDDALAELRGNGLQQPTACITFDDGYHNNITEALPLLARHRLPATIYLATGLIGTDRLLWTTELDLAVQQTTAPHVEVPGILPRTQVPLRSDQRDIWLEQLKERMKSLPAGQRRVAHAVLLTTLGPIPPASGWPFRMMGWDDVNAGADSGWLTFGAHTVSHELVGRLDDPELETEITGSVEEVGRRTDRITRTFAYPNGRAVDFDARAADVLRAAGCTAAVSTIEGLNDPDTDPFALRRITLGDAVGPDEFRLRAAGFRWPPWRRRAA